LIIAIRSRRRYNLRRKEKMKIQIFEVYKSVNNKDWYRVGGTPFPQLALEVKKNLEKHGIYAKIVAKMEKPS
jgi:hypothetical protein